MAILAVFSVDVGQLTRAGGSHCGVMGTAPLHGWEALRRAETIISTRTYTGAPHHLPLAYSRIAGQHFSPNHRTNEPTSAIAARIEKVRPDFSTRPSRSSIVLLLHSPMQ